MRGNETKNLLLLISFYVATKNIMLVSKSQENIYITTSYHTVFQRAVLDFAPLCNEWQIKTAMMSMRHLDRFVKCLSITLELLFEIWW